MPLSWRYKARQQRPVLSMLMIASSMSATARELLCVLRGAVGSFQFLHIVLGKLRLIKRDGQLVDLASERKRDLVIAIIHRRAGVCPDVKGLVPLQDQRHRPIHGLRRNHFAVDLQRARAATAEAAQLVERKRRKTQTIVFEFKLDGVLTGRQSVRAFPANPFQVKQVPDEY